MDHATEIAEGKRFKFGANWENFLSTIGEEQINETIESIKRMLGKEGLEEKTFLDIGSGSGLFSLAARRLGAKVYSFDYDSQSAACTQEMKRRYRNEDQDWYIEEGSVLDSDYINSLGTFDVV